jgi:AAHS family 4-hydroxybenzoate transporter-like MFS transporter
VAGALLQPLGWQGVVAFGGIVTLVFAASFVFALPESLEYLINRGNDRPRALRILNGIAPEIAISESTHLIAGRQGVRKVTLGQLVQEGRALGSALVWVGMFMNLMIYFFLQKWLTSLLVQVGLSLQTAIQATALSLAAGIVAAFILGPLMDRIGPYAVVAGLFLASAAAVALMGSVLETPETTVILLVSLVVGFCLSGGQKANNALTVYFYPTALRGTGLGWSLGIGRIGGVLGPLAAGELLTLGWSPAGLFYAAVAPMVVGAVAIWAMGQAYGHGAKRAPLPQSHKT